MYGGCRKRLHAGGKYSDAAQSQAASLMFVDMCIYTFNHISQLSLENSHSIIVPLNTYNFNVLMSNGKIFQKIPSGALPAGLQLPTQFAGLPNITPG
jgi:hypothetical protein